MSRLGDLILLERTRRKLSPKAVAKQCGITEKYLLEVEAGKRIIADDQARRILKTMGMTEHNEVDFSLDEIAATVDISTIAPKPQLPKAPEPHRVAASAGDNGGGGIWLDALAGVLKAVPVYNAAWQVVERRMVPIQNERIEGSAPDKVLYFRAPDDSMRGFRILSGDLALLVPAHQPVDEAVMLVAYAQHRALRKVKVLPVGQVMLQRYDREYGAETLPVTDVQFLGRAVRLEIALD